LIDGINERGGEAYLMASTHDVVGDPWWETTGGKNKFIEALIDAYRIVNKENTLASYISNTGEETIKGELGVNKA